MSLFGNHTKTENQITRLTIEAALVFFGVLMVAMGTITYVITAKSAASSKAKVVNLVNISNSQQIHNLNLYLDKVEDTAALMFSDDAYCEFDATAETADQFEMVQRKEQVETRLQDLGVLQNFSDFGIVYADDSTLGWISNTTIKLFPDGGLFEYLNQHMSDNKTQSGWFFDYDKCYDRIYYVKRLNENAILVSAFYSRELMGTFSELEDTRGLTTYLMDSENMIVYAEDSDLIGKNVTDILGDVAENYGDYQVVTGDKVVISGTCQNGWRVICTAPTESLFYEEQNLMNYSMIVTVVIIVVMCLVGGLLCIRMAKKQRRVLSDIKRKADYDQLTSVYNKQSYREIVSASLEQRSNTAVHTLVMLDIDNFKRINDTYGHHEGDKLLKSAAAEFLRVFGADATIGRVGGDEFSIYEMYMYKSVDEAKTDMEKRIGTLFENFHEKFREEYDKCGMSLSAGGILVHAGDDLNYDDIFQKADRALYVSKRSGKDQFNWYER